MNDKKMERIKAFVKLMTARKYPNAETFAKNQRKFDDDNTRRMQGTSAKTIHRDIQYLKNVLKAPMDYAPAEKGYYLHSAWSLPGLMLSPNEALAAKFSNRVARPFLPVPMQKELDDVVLDIEAAVCDPDDLSLADMESVVVATVASAPTAKESIEIVLDAWKKTRRLRMDYRTPNHAQPTRRDIDIHALFLAKDAWYARAWCHLRHNFRSFALHRIVAAELLPERFERSAVVVAEVAQGKLFDCNYCTNVQVRVAPARAVYFQERTWFPGQQVTRRPDGALDVTYPAIPEPLLVQWVLSFQGAVAVTAPETIRAAIRDAGAAIVQGHAPRP